MNRMQQTTVCLVFLDSCGCGPTPRLHLRAEHPGWRSMAIESPPVKRDLVVTGSERVIPLFYGTGRACGQEKSEKRRVQAATNSSIADRKCGQRARLGIHVLNRWTASGEVS